MNLKQLALKLNEHALSGNHRVAMLPQLRKHYLGKRQLPGDIFTDKTIFDKADKYFFHYGGRDEMQFNVGEEWINDRPYTRYGLCFSLEPSRSLVDPINALKPFRQRFDRCVKVHPGWFKGFRMWYFDNGPRSENYKRAVLPEEWFQRNNFICIGGLIAKSYAALSDNDVELILT